MITTYTYDRANRLKTVNAGGTITTYTHDAAGNRISAVSPTESIYYTWDAKGQMSEAEPLVGIINFTYNADGQRVAKQSDDGSSTGYLYDDKKMLHETEEVGGEITNTYTTTSDQGYGDLISEYGSELYHQFDAQANTNALLDPDGTVQAKYKYYAFGQVSGVSVAGESWTTLTINEWASMSTDAWATLPAISTQLGMGGQKQYYVDPETQLYLLGSGTNGRYYDAATGRFLSEDPERQKTGDPNLYLYVQNDPVNKLDPSGHDTENDEAEKKRLEEEAERKREAAAAAAKAATANADQKAQQQAQANQAKEQEAQSSQDQQKTKQEPVGKADPPDQAKKDSTPSDPTGANTAFSPDALLDDKGRPIQLTAVAGVQMSGSTSDAPQEGLARLMPSPTVTTQTIQSNVPNYGGAIGTTVTDSSGQVYKWTRNPDDPSRPTLVPANGGTNPIAIDPTTQAGYNTQASSPKAQSRSNPPTPQTTSTADKPDAWQAAQETSLQQHLQDLQSRKDYAHSQGGKNEDWLWTQVQDTTLQLQELHLKSAIAYDASKSGENHQFLTEELLKTQLQRDDLEDRKGKHELRSDKDTRRFLLPAIESDEAEAKFRAELNKAMDPKMGMRLYTPEMAEKVLMRLKAAMGTDNVVLLAEAMQDPVIQRAIVYAERNKLDFTDPIRLRQNLEARRAANEITVKDPTHINPADIDILVKESQDFGPLGPVDRFMMGGGGDIGAGLLTLGLGAVDRLGETERFGSAPKMGSMKTWETPPAVPVVPDAVTPAPKPNALTIRPTLDLRDAMDFEAHGDKSLDSAYVNRPKAGTSSTDVKAGGNAAKDAASAFDERVKALSYNAEQKATDITQGQAAARYEQSVGRQVKVGDTEGVDLVDPKEGPLSVKGPLGVSKAGDAVQIKQPMVDGLAKSVVKDVQFNTATKKVVVDLSGLSKQQQQQVIDAVTKQVGTNPTKEIQYLGRSD